MPQSSGKRLLLVVISLSIMFGAKEVETWPRTPGVIESSGIRSRRSSDSDSTLYKFVIGAVVFAFTSRLETTPGAGIEARKPFFWRNPLDPYVKGCRIQ